MSVAALLLSVLSGIGIVYLVLRLFLLLCHR